MKSKLLTLSLLLICNIIFSQNKKIVGVQQNTNNYNLKSLFNNYEIYEINTNSISAYAKDKKDNFTFSLQLGKQINRNLTLFESDLRSPNTVTILNTNQGREIIPELKYNISYKGYDENKNKVRLTIDDNYISGYIKDNEEIYYIEPLENVSNTRIAKENLYVVYKSSSVINKQGANNCISIDVDRKMEAYSNNNQMQYGACYTVKLATAFDKKRFSQFSYNVGRARIHNTAVINGVQGFFDNELDVDISFEIADLYLEANRDPWVISTDSETQLDNFRNWAISINGFPNYFNLATLRAGKLYYTEFDTRKIYGAANRNGINQSQARVLYVTKKSFSGAITLQTHESGHSFGSAPHGCQGSISGCWSPSQIDQMNLGVSKAIGKTIFGCDVKSCSRKIINLSANSPSNVLEEGKIINSRAIIAAKKVVNYLSVEEISLKAGFHAKNGSKFTASIDDDCFTYDPRYNYTPSRFFPVVISPKPTILIKREQITNEQQLENNSQLNELKIYPNPAKDVLNILASKNKKVYFI